METLVYIQIFFFYPFFFKVSAFSFHFFFVSFIYLIFLFAFILFIFYFFFSFFLFKLINPSKYFKHIFTVFSCLVIHLYYFSPYFFIRAMSKNFVIDRDEEKESSGWSFFLFLFVSSFVFVVYRIRKLWKQDSHHGTRGDQGRRGGSRRLPLCVKDNDIVSAITRNVFAASKICVTWEVLGSGNTWNEGGEIAMKFLVSFSETFFLCCVSDESELKKRVRFLQKFKNYGLDRDRVLFCTTSSGYRAFIRQINPAILISHDARESEFLSRVLPYIVFVGEETLTAPNIQTIPSIKTLVKSL